MSFQEELYYKIEAYLSGDLDAEEVAAFESQISGDDLLKAEVEKHKVANALIVEQRLLSVKSILQEERTKDSNSNNFNKPFGFILLAVAAIGIGTAVWLLNKEDIASSSAKEKNTDAQIVSGKGAAENKDATGNTEHTIKDASQHVTSSADNGFHKQQIQQIEEQIRVDEKGILYIDSAFTHKHVESDVIHPKIQNTPAVGPDVKAISVPCSGVSIHAVVKTDPSCSHEGTGTIFVNNIEGGTKPYSVTLSSASYEPVVNGELSKGIYKVVISDASGCIQSYSNIVIAEKDCPRDYSFNPFIGEKWTIESYHAQGQLEIYNKGGVLYYKENIDANNSNEWTGIGFNNQIMPGYYIFVIKYIDGTMKKGSVTIVQ